MAVRVEVCVTSVQEAVAAGAVGVDSVEVCTWLASGGVTPSWGLVTMVRDHVPCQVRVLVRPAVGPFHYDAMTLDVLVADAHRIAEKGLGVVSGILGPDGRWDEASMERIRAASHGAELTFHRAIDHAPDPARVAEHCMSLGVERILSSGGAATALEGAPILRRMVRSASGVRIAAGGGVRPENVVELVERSGVEEVHFSAQQWVRAATSGPSLGVDQATLGAVVVSDMRRVEGVLNALVKAGLR
jgi:copper homeostasis protein